MMIDSPCHGCTAETGRTPTCHNAGHCERHDAWKAQHDREREERRQQKAIQNTYRTYKVELSSTLKKEAHR